MVIATLIIKKAVELFSFYGIRSIDVGDIADGMGISKKTIRSFFINKAAIVEAVIDEMLGKNQIGCGLIKKQSDHAVGEMYVLIYYLGKFYANLNLLMIDDLKFAYPNSVEKLNNYKSGFLVEQVKANINTGIGEGLYRDSLDATIAASFTVQNLTFISKISQETEGFSVKDEVVGQMIFGLVDAKGALRVHEFMHIHSLVRHKKNDYGSLWNH